MPIRVACSKCQTLFNVADEKIGKLIRCSKCQTVFRAEAPTVEVADLPEVQPVPKSPTNSETTVPPASSLPPADVVAVAAAKTEKKRSKVPFVLAGCAAFLFFLFIICGAGGYFFYVKITDFVTTVRNDLAQLRGKPNDDKNTQDRAPSDNDKLDNTQKPDDKKPDDKKPDDKKPDDKKPDDKKPDDKKPDNKQPEDKNLDDGRAFTLKIKSQPSASKMMRIVTTETLKGSVKEVIDERTQMKPVNKSMDDVHTCVVLLAGEPQPVRFKETYEKATFPDMFRPKLPYGTRTITYDRKDDGYQVTASGDVALPPNDLNTLARHARNAYTDTVILPGKPVRVGDTWTPDVKALSERYFNHLEINVADSKAGAKLAKVIEKDGKPTALIAINLRLAVVKTPWLPYGAADATCTLDLHGTQQFPLDGSDTISNVSLTGKMEAHYIDVNLKRAVSDLSADMTLNEERSPESAAPEMPPETGWQKVETMQGRFTAEFPGKPTIVPGKAEFTDDKGIVYSIQLFNVRRSNPTTPQQLLELVLPNNAAKAMDRKDLTIDDGFGVEFTVEQNVFNAAKNMNVPVRIQERAYVVKKTHRYDIKIQSPKDVTPAAEDVKRFFDSFKVLETP